MAILSESSKISVSLVIALLGGAAWMTTVYVQGQSNAAEIQSVKSDVKQVMDMKADIAIMRSDLNRIAKILEEKGKK